MHGVVISEKWDKRGAKYSAAGVPFPYDSKVTYERARRQPLGPDFNTASAHRCEPPRLVQLIASRLCLQPIPVQAGA